MQSPDMESAYNAIVNEINVLNTQTLDIDLEETGLVIATSECGK